MPPVFLVTIMAPEQTAFRGKARSLVAPGRDGYFGVLAHHAAIVAELGVGRLSLVDEDGAQRLFAVAGGFLEAGDNEVTILADSAETGSGIDVARAESAQQRAQDRLDRLDEDLDVARAQAALKRALNRIKVARESQV